MLAGIACSPVASSSGAGRRDAWPGLLGVGYGVALIGKGLDPAAGLFAGGLAAVAELAFWALEPGAAVRIGRAATG